MAQGGSGRSTRKGPVVTSHSRGPDLIEYCLGLTIESVIERENLKSLFYILNNLTCKILIRCDVRITH